MKIGILADTHGAVTRAQRAVELLIAEGAEVLIHCGDLNTPEIVAACSGRPLYFVFGNHDCDVVPDLLRAADEHHATCLRWGGEVMLGEKRIAIVHGHLTMDLKPLLDAEPDYLFSGHSHMPADWQHGRTRRINPGALFRADKFTVALLDLITNDVSFLTVPD